MTHKDERGNIWVIAEPPGKCELCGAVAETRPYGPDGAQICHACGLKIPEIVEAQMKEFFG